MKAIRRVALILGLIACIAVAVCLLSDLNDEVFLPLGLFLNAVASVLNIFAAVCEKREKGDVK